MVAVNERAVAKNLAFGEQISGDRMVCSDAATKQKQNERHKNMKTVNKKNILGAGMAMAMALTAWLPTTASAADETKPMKPMKGGEHLLMLQGINTEAQAEALKPGDSLAMVCAKCKSVTVENVNIEKGHIKTVTLGEKHLCPGCGGTIEIVGQGKGKTEVRKHTCSKCGDDSAFCCATKPGSGATKGMEKEKK